MKTICLFGGCNRLNEDLPYHTPEKDKMYVGYAIWNMGYIERAELMDGCKNFIIDIHTLHTRKPGYIDWLKQIDAVKLLQKTNQDIPDSFAFPLEEIILKFNSRYFLSSFAYMIAWAIFQGYERIEIYKTNMIYGDDLIQRYNFEYWIGRAKGAGIEVVTTEQCDLLKCGAMYGYEVDNTLGVYIQRYISILTSNIKVDINNIKSNIYDFSFFKRRKSLNEMQIYIENIERNFAELTTENVIFLKEILNRHKIGGDGNGEAGEEY